MKNAYHGTRGRAVDMSQASLDTPKDAILAALDKAVASEAFSRSDRQARFLRHVVETTLRGEPGLLKESLLGVDVFERPADWDPRLDPIVRMEAARLRKRLAKYYESSGTADPVRIELPVGAYVPVFINRPDAAEPSPQPIPVEFVEPPAPPQEKIPQEKIRWLSVAVVGLAIAASIAAIRYLRRDVLINPANAASIAVLPFANLSSDPANQYFVDGLTDEITDLLARNKSLRVVARSSASRFRAKDADLSEVGRELNVANILEGSVERSGDRIKIIAHLERVSDGSHLWSNTYERQTSDLFGAQSEVATAIAENLKAAAGLPGAPHHIPKEEAVEWVMKGRYELQQNTPQSVTRAEEDFQHAINLDPEYAIGYSALGAAKYNQAPARVGDRTEIERRESDQLSRKALELDPGLTTPHVVLASLAMQYDWDWHRAERELQMALAGTPNAGANTFYATFLILRGRPNEADKYLQRAQDLDPFGVATLNNIASARYWQGRTAELRDVGQKLLLVAPGMVAAQLRNAASHVDDGHPELAWPEFQKIEQRFPAAAMSEAWARARVGQREEALRLIRPFEEKYPNTGVPFQGFALVYAFLGDEASTVKWLNRSADAREYQALNLGVNPAFKSMENSPGFRALKKRMGLDR